MKRPKRLSRPNNSNLLRSLMLKMKNLSMRKNKRRRLSCQSGTQVFLTHLFKTSWTLMTRKCFLSSAATSTRLLASWWLKKRTRCVSIFSWRLRVAFLTDLWNTWLTTQLRYWQLSSSKFRSKLSPPKKPELSRPACMSGKTQTRRITTTKVKAKVRLLPSNSRWKRSLPRRVNKSWWDSWITCPPLTRTA